MCRRHKLSSWASKYPLATSPPLTKQGEGWCINTKLYLFGPILLLPFYPGNMVFLTNQQIRQNMNSSLLTVVGILSPLGWHAGHGKSEFCLDIEDIVGK
jgi:hypothetical protein